MPSDSTEPLLGATELAALLEVGVKKRFEPGDRLVSIGAMSTEVFYVLSGRAKIVVISESGQESVFGLRTAGEFVGEMSTLNEDRRSADVVATEPIETVMVSAARFIDFLHRHPAVTLAMLRMQSRRLHQMTIRTMMGSRSIKARVASRLVELGGFNHAAVVHTPVTVEVLQTELAKWVDATRESTSKALGDLKREGIVETGRGRVMIKDIAGLRSASVDQGPSSPL